MSRRIHILGPLSIMDDGQPSQLLSNTKGCALLAYLLARGRPERREHLADLLWDSADTASSLRNLRVTLSRIRPHLPGLEITRKTVRYQPQPDETTDYLVLTEALSRKDSPFTLSDLRLYQGDLLESFYLEGEPRFMEWLAVERERLRRDVLDAYQDLCRSLAEAQHWGEGAHAAAQWLMIDEYSESAARWRMQFLAAAGKASEALVEFDHFRSRLRQELGLDPDSETLALADKLHSAYGTAATSLFAAMDFSIHLDWPARDALASPGPLPPQSYIPFRRNPDFTGRTHTLIQLADALLPWEGDPAPATPLVAFVTGIGGMGKTQLAVEFAYRYGRFFPGGVFWLTFEEAPCVPGEFAGLGELSTLDLFGSASNLSLAEKIRRVQRKLQEPEPRLLIFDNCEDETLLRQWLPVTGGCRILVTSRYGNWVREIEGLRLPLAGLTASESVTFLQALAPRLEKGTALEIAEELGYLPLALHLSGSFLRHFQHTSVTQYLAQLRTADILSHPAMQGRGVRHSPTDHATHVAKTFAASLARFDPQDEIDTAARQLLAYVLAFAPGEPIPHPLLVAAFVVDEHEPLQLLLAEDALARLVSIGFVTRESNNALIIHRLLTSFIRAELNDAELREAQQTVEAQVLYRLEEQWKAQIFLGTLPIPSVHLRFITEAALPRGDRQAAILADYFGRHLLDSHEYEAALGYFEQAMDIWRNTLKTREFATAVCLTNLGLVYLRLAKEEENVRDFYTEAHEICLAELGTGHLKTAQSVMNLAMIQARLGEYAAAEENYQMGLAIYDRVLEPDDLKIALAAGNLGQLYRRMGDYEQAMYWLERQLTIREKVLGADHPETANGYASKGFLLWHMGRFSEGAALHRRALDIRIAAFGDTNVTVASSLVNLAVCQIGLGAVADAEANLLRALKVREQLLAPEHPLVLQTHVYLGWAHTALKKFESAEAHLCAALSVLEKATGFQDNYADNLCGLGNLYLKMGQLDQALIYLEQTLAFLEKLYGPDHPDIAATLMLLGEWHARTGSEEVACSYFERARQVYVHADLQEHPNFKSLDAHRHIESLNK